MRTIDLRKPTRRWAIAAVAVLAGLVGWAALDPSGRSDAWPVARTIEGWANPLDFDRDGRALRIWRMDDRFVAVDLATGAEREIPKTDIRWLGPTSPDGRSVLEYHFFGEWRVLDAATQAEVGRHQTDGYPAHHPPVFAADGRSLVFLLGSPDHAEEARTWDFTTGAIAHRPLSRPPCLTIARGTSAPSRWVPSPDGCLVAYPDEAAGGVQLWDVATDRPAGPALRTPATRFYDTDDPRFAFTPDGRSLLHGQHDGRVEVWDVARRTLDRTLVVGSPDDFIDRLAISEDGRLLGVHQTPWIKDPIRRGYRSARDAVLPTRARPEDDSTVLVDLDSGRPLARAPGGREFAISPDGRLVALRHRDRVTIHRVPTPGQS